MDPVGALIGAILMALGTVVLYGAIKNRKVFGAKGLVPTALSTGTIADITKIPEAFPTSVRSGAQEIGDKIKDLFETQATWVVPRTVQDAVARIAETDVSLAEKIAHELNTTDSNSKRQDLMVLGQLLGLADAKNHKADADVIRQYIESRNGESI